MFQGEVEFCKEGLPAGLSSGEVLFGEKVAVGDVVREHGEGSVEEVAAPSAEAVDHGGEFFFVGGVVKFGRVTRRDREVIDFTRSRVKN